MLRNCAMAFFLAILLSSAVLARKPHCTLRVHAQANSRDSEVFASPVTTPLSRKNIFIEKIPAISERDVTAFRSYQASDGTLGALIQLNDHGRLALETLSTDRKGTTLVVLLNGRAVTELLVDRSVSDGQLYINSGLTPDDIRSMERDWPQLGASKR